MGIQGARREVSSLAACVDLLAVPSVEDRAADNSYNPVHRRDHYDRCRTVMCGCRRAAGAAVLVSVKALEHIKSAAVVRKMVRDNPT